MIVEEYVREDGSCPFRGWFNVLDVQAAAKVATAIVRMELGNLSSVKWTGGGLSKGRIDWGRVAGSISPRTGMNRCLWVSASPVGTTNGLNRRCRVKH
ncbi:MAG: hypothetical protein WA793_13290 [Sphingorhabdus sp.]|uniref:hypothetical protein n=1 Tax=Sphingorhabdus sp. TaxID=1902408 RepID=UPI003CA14B57